MQDRKRWEIRDVKPLTRRKVVYYAKSKGISVADALELLTKKIKI